MGTNGTLQQVIRYGSGPTAVGPVFVARTERGVCMLRLVAGRERPLDELRRHFPRAELVQDQEAVKQALRKVDEFLAGKRAEGSIPLDLHGTPFQRRVWKVMQQVPRGQTCSYRELARRAGKPRAVRAVANACASNPVALLVPCHRIVRSDGGLGGYYWGLKKKKQLLRLDRALLSTTPT
jgi:AraC family transcriptional regulator of adaptative response/methylated-DNA-[protein]-cysteine methyltransferase